MKTWRDADVWADHADDSGVDCPVCREKILGLGLLLGEIEDAVREHMAEAHDA